MQPCKEPTASRVYRSAPPPPPPPHTLTDTHTAPHLQHPQLLSHCLLLLLQLLELLLALAIHLSQLSLQRLRLLLRRRQLVLQRHHSALRVFSGLQPLAELLQLKPLVLQPAGQVGTAHVLSCSRPPASGCSSW